jgi:hypothetical protein
MQRSLVDVGDRAALTSSYRQFSLLKIIGKVIEMKVCATIAAALVSAGVLVLLLGCKDFANS